MELTRSEMQIMDVFWDSGAPLSRSDLLERSCDKSWKDSSVHILLNGLLQKEMIREVGFVKRSKTYGRTFLPTMTREAYRCQPKLVELVQALLSREDMTAEDKARIKQIACDL